MAWEQSGPGFARKDKEVLFLFGAARSGTTMLNNILYRFFGYGMGPEGTFVVPFSKRLSGYGSLDDDANLQRLIADMSQCDMLHIARHKYRRNPFDVSPDLIRKRLLERSYAGVVYAIFECVAELQGCPRVGNKNPGFWRHLDLLDHLFPTQAKYICIVRDGRDVALSIKKVRWGLNSTYISAKVWARSLEALAAFQRSIGPDRLHVTHYEDLLREPEETLRKMLGFLGVEVPEEDIAQAVEHLSQGKKSANYDKWRQEMSAHDLRMFEGIAGEQLAAQGYELSGGSTRAC